MLRSFGDLEQLLAQGLSVAHACENLGLDEVFVKDWMERVALPLDPGQVLDSSRFTNAVFPIFAQGSSEHWIEQVGSGVAMVIGNELFALTAAHVADSIESGVALLMPAADGIARITGYWSSSPKPESGVRADDKVDSAYCRLTCDWRERLSPLIAPLTLQHVTLSNDILTGEIFTFVGYPWRKSRLRNGKYETDATTYTGHASATDTYDSLGYDRRANVLARVRLRKTFSYRLQTRNVSPHPQGISGGAVFAWPRTWIDRHDASKLKLAAICHSFHSKHHCLAATRVSYLLQGILRNNPSLAAHFASAGL